MTRPSEPQDLSAYQAILDALPATDAQPTAAQREAAWQRLQRVVHDPARAPFTDEVRAPLELLRDETGESAPVPPRAAVTGAHTVSAAHTASAGAKRVRLQFGIAAAVAVMAGAGVWGSGSTAYTVDAGEAARQVVLADGSTAWVAPGSTVRVSRRLGWPSLVSPAARDVQLEGEAYFEVRRDGRPFVVHAPAVDVRVLGTRFSVRGASGAATARVDVSEGRVEVRSARSQVVLGAGEGARLIDGALRTRPVDAAKVAAWRTGGLAALDEPLGDIVAELSRRYGVELTVSRDVDVNAVVSLFYPSAPSAEVVVGDLCTAQQLVFTRTSRGFAISKP